MGIYTKYPAYSRQLPDYFQDLPWGVRSTGRGEIFPVAPVDVACGCSDDTLDPNIFGYTGDRAGKEQVGLRKKLKWCELHASMVRVE